MERKIISISTKGNTDIIDITKKIEDILNKADAKSGVAHIFVVGSTAGLSIVEYEPGLVKDLKEFFEKIAPKDAPYFHHEKWHDDNGSSHVKATLLKPDLTIPFEDKKLLSGTWQQIILIDFDTKPRTREIIITILEDE